MHLRSQAQRSTCAVERGKTTTDDDHFVAFLHRYRLALNFFAQVGDGIDHSFCIITWQIRVVADPTANAQVDGIEALGEQVIDSEVFAKLDVALEIHAKLPDMIDFAVHHIFLQAIFGNTVAQHATRLGLHVKDFTVMAF